MIEIAEGVEERILQHVFRVMCVARDCQTSAVHMRLVAPDELIEGLSVSRQNLINQITGCVVRSVIAAGCRLIGIRVHRERLFADLGPLMPAAG